MIDSLLEREKFEYRHNALTDTDKKEMLDKIGVSSVDELIEQTVPASIRLDKPLNLPEPQSEYHFLKEFKNILSENKLFKNYIGMGYYDSVTPTVILRNIFENPGWYTAYTPYQAEIAQGRLEALINFQTMVIDLTGMEIANASLLDEATAAAEAMTMLFDTRKGARKKATTILVDEKTFPQTLDVLNTRSIPIGINVEVGPLKEMDLSRDDVYAIMIQYPNSDGTIKDISSLLKNANEQGVKVAVAADLLALTLIKSPGELGADVVFGSSQRFGIPLGFGGPHAAYFATKEAFKRLVPGRMIGVSVDRHGRKGYRMALQTREQHIRREKATSNICTAQVLLAVMAGAYGVYHGPKGLKSIANRIHALAKLTEAGLQKLGLKQVNKLYFDTIKIEVESEDFKKAVKAEAESRGVNFRYFADNYIGVSFDQTKEPEDVQEVFDIFSKVLGTNSPDLNAVKNEVSIEYPVVINRTTTFMEHPIFNMYHSEHEMLRYLKRLENKDISLTHSMISLGSCTMKLNATTEMIPVSWPELGAIHPFAPADQTKGYHKMINELNDWLCEITGFAKMSMQPNSGAQGEYAGLLTIRNYHIANGDSHRNVAIIPSSAHGTNPASAVMAGMKVVITKCDDTGNIDLDDLREKAELHKDNLAALMITYPSTHGVFEEDILEICQIIHDNGGQVYMDGANMNAQVGLTSPAKIGADVCHLNLHKTFCIPHGGGGPGMGPIGVVEHLVPHLPGHFLTDDVNGNNGAVSAAPYGSASILAISYAYIRMMGGEGLTNATKLAILNTNYIKESLKGHYDVLYSGKNGRAAHEMILEIRDFKTSSGVDATDIAKRLMDYGYHAPTVSFPVAGTLMIEPTESETKAELDRFCEALISIRGEIQDIIEGKLDAENNPLKNAPHTAAEVMGEEWERPYTRERAVYPLGWVAESKFWPSVNRIDDAFGDRNLVCSCPPLENYTEESEVV